MPSIIHFGCPECASELAAAADGPRDVDCTRCGGSTTLARSSTVRTGARVDVCALCGHSDLYVQKDFNRTLGLTIVVMGCLGSLVFFAMREPALAVGALVAMALVDGLIYLLVGEVAVCYSCHAIYRGFEHNPDHQPFDLERLERYGGRPPRR